MNTLNQLLINAKDLKFRYSGAAEHYEWNDGNKAENQTRDPDTGQPLWKVRVTIVDSIAEATTTATVTVPSLTEPTAPFDTEIWFDELSVKFWVMNGNMGQSFKAAAFSTTPPNSVKTATTTAPGKPKIKAAAV